MTAYKRLLMLLFVCYNFIRRDLSWNWNSWTG